MLPSLLARDIRRGLKQFLIGSYEPSNSFFHGVMKRFVDNEALWMKGPYLSVGLPFRVGDAGTRFFGDFETQFPSYVHQEAAWRNLESEGVAANTIIATGTGSGKTECFLYPVLDHCMRAKREQQKGVKALIIYPMNALATDQARRFAEVISKTPSFAGLRVGLFIRNEAGTVGSMVMSATSVITDRETLRANPPDVLLTNYKMLDYLLIRPKDRALWSHNTPTTLRYVVVDELHTFDGAQGTDLAILLRRLRARLKASPDQLICVGTSATLGSSSNLAPLCEYAQRIFRTPFLEKSVISETRLSTDEFLGAAVIEHVLQPRTDYVRVLDPEQYADEKAGILAWFAVLFPDRPVPDDVTDDAWRAELGALLKQHLLFVNLLRLLKNGTSRFDDLQHQMQGPLPESARGSIGKMLDALLVLVSWARDPAGPGLPLVTVRVQLWLRELRRMVAKVDIDGNAVDIRASADLKAHPDDLYLPVIQCADCHTTAWLSRLPKASNKLSTSLDDIYQAWFAGDSEVVRLYPDVENSQPQVDGIRQRICASCGNLQPGENSCQACGHDQLIAVFRTSGTVTRERRGIVYSYHDRSCPACGNRDRMILFGARIATLGAQIVERSWGSIFNDDKKLIAFSDSVQDAAHRAGFFGARTYANTIRTAIAKAVEILVRPTAQWAPFLAQLESVWQTPGSPLMMNSERFVSEFIAPNMTWLRDWAQELLQKGALPSGSRLPGLVLKRFAWEAFAEFTYRSDRANNLERTGVAVLAPDSKAVDRVAIDAASLLSEQFGLREISPDLTYQWLWGFLNRLRQRGAVWHPEMREYAQDANIWRLGELAGRGAWLPGIGPYTPHPVFLTLGTHDGFDRLENSRGRSWFALWLEASVGIINPLVAGASEAIYLECIKLLEQAGLLTRTASVRGDTIGLAPGQLSLRTDVRFLFETTGNHRLAVPAEVAQRLVGMRCIDSPGVAYDVIQDPIDWQVERFSRSDLRRVFAAEHTGLIGQGERQSLEGRFKAKRAEPWYENLLSATPTLELGVDIGDLSSVLLCGVPPNQASYVQRVGRAGRRDGNSVATTLVNAARPHDLYFFEETEEMLSGDIAPPGVFLNAAEVLRRQLCAFCLDDWVGSGVREDALPDKTSVALDAIDKVDKLRFPHNFLDYVLSNETRLLTSFLNLLKGEIEPQVAERLTEFCQGTGDSDSVRIRLLKTLEAIGDERRGYKRRAEVLRGQIRTLKARPSDEYTLDEISKLDRERQAALELIKEINGRELLNTLTDAGLIPNYAFPEAGVELKSILWRKRAEGDPGEKPFISLPVLRYDRPAVSALSEFAPENRFYANQRRVEIDQINMGLAPIEWWRLCPSCHHVENLDRRVDAESDLACPTCQDPMWANVSQRRQLLRFKQAISNSDDTKVRIDDSADDRDPKYYLRQLLAEFEPTDIRDAWRVKDIEVPFGFEFISHATFREINFGESGRGGENFKVADFEIGRPGFRVCKSCGKAQAVSYQTSSGDEAQQHAYDCEKRGSDEETNIVPCLYLYREFDSEALRILVPYTKMGVDAEVVQSFIAALYLGLKKRFGGRVDHLRIVTQDEPGADGGPRRQYVMIYDTVPGGTGYLQQLLAHDTETLSAVLRMAHTTLVECPCNADPDRDGCYRCLYQYRLGHVMQLVSRDRAIDVLSELLGVIDQLEKVQTISDIFINPNFDSQLEARFIESLRRLGGREGRLAIKLVQEVVNGKSGYLLEVGSQQYWIEPQVDVGTNDGVSERSKPDFMIRPVRQKSVRRPIAVFCDGWRYHRSIMRQDALKRDALVTSGQYWVWSVTHEDVRDALEGKAQTDLESPLTAMARHGGDEAPVSLPRAERNAFTNNAISQLCSWLGTETLDDRDPVVDELVRNSGWATFLMVVPPRHEQFRALGVELERLWATLPEWMQERPSQAAPAISKADVQPTVSFWWPGSFASGQLKEARTPGLLFIEDEGAIDDSIQHERWRQWLRLFNTFQVLPGFILATRSGMRGGDYERLSLAKGGATPSDMRNGTDAWADVMNEVVEFVKPGLEYLRDRGYSPPDELGFEHVGARGEVDAEAELAWIGSKVIVLLESQREFEAVWLSQGWRLVIATDDWAHNASLALSKEGRKNEP